MLTMCNYYGMSDRNGRCVGHPVKTTEEYGNILKSFGEDIRLVCSPCIADGIKNISVFSQICKLPYDISIEGNGIIKRIFDKFKLFRNISVAIKNTGTVFFYQVDFFFFLYLKLFYRRSSDRKIVILIYHQDFTGGKLAGFLKKVYLSALDNVDCVIYTQRDTNVSHDKALWLPDFIYRSNEYDKYGIIPKTDRVVCLGSMSRYKQIEELIAVWHHTSDLPQLIIAGRFDSEDRVNEIKKDLPQNVTLRDEVLSNEEYMSLLSGSKYSILPYDMKQYKARTSGVLLESIYCGVIPIAPSELLEQNKLPGLGYNQMSEISNLLRSNTDSIINEYPNIYKEYGMDYAGNVLKEALIL